MGMTVTTDDKGVKVFAKEKETSNGKFVMYSLGVSSKNQNNEWVNGYISCRFKKGVEIANKTKIKIKNAFFTATKSGDRVYTSLMITDFDVLEEGESSNGEGWVDMAGINEGELPFAD